MKNILLRILLCWVSAASAFETIRISESSQSADTLESLPGKLHHKFYLICSNRQSSANRLITPANSGLSYKFFFIISESNSSVFYWILLSKILKMNSLKKALLAVFMWAIVDSQWSAGEELAALL